MGCKLAKSGFLARHGVKLIGTKLDAIDRSEDRELFKETMEKIHQPCVPSDIAYTVDECVAIANRLGYPVIVRPAYTLGGAGGGVAYDEEELRSISHNGLMLAHYAGTDRKIHRRRKEIQFEVLARATSPSAPWKISTPSVSIQAIRSSSRPPSRCG
ncbi:MAG: hypothetical protein ACLS4Z_07495 [Christensenellaceae bacterium]